MNAKLKQIIIKKLYQDLSHVEIIPHKDSIWFIDRENKYWYLIYKKNGTLYWRWHFFSVFFNLFSLKQNEFEPIMSEWVEEVLNCKINTPLELRNPQNWWVEEVLNCKINTPHNHRWPQSGVVEEVLNCKVNTPLSGEGDGTWKVEEVLNYKINAPIWTYTTAKLTEVEEVLNSK